MKKKYFAMFLAVSMMMTACSKPAVAPDDVAETTPAETTAVTEEVVEILYNDPEVGRAIELGLVPEEMQSDYEKIITEKELISLITIALEKLDSSTLEEWKEISADATDEETIRQEGTTAIYMAALLLEDVPAGNADTDERVDWNKWLEDGVTYNWGYGQWGSKIFAKYYENQNYPLYNQYMDYIEGGFQNGALYCLLTASRYSNNILFELDENGQGMNLMDPLTREDAILAVVRWYESYHKEPIYVSPLDTKATTSTITKEQIENAAEVPEVSSQKFPLYRGVGEFTKSSVLQSGSNKVQEYSEADIKYLAESGYNYLRINMSFTTFGAPDYPTDENYINVNELEDLDELIGWCMEYGLHATVNMMAVPKRHDGNAWNELSYWAESAGDTAETPYTEEEWKNIKDCFTMLSKRYEDIPIEYLSFELINEGYAYDLEKQMSNWKTVISAIREITPERILIISVDNHEETALVEAFAKEGVAISYHSYNPRNFVYFQNDWYEDSSGDTSVPAPQWPYVDENGTEWSAELIYETYIKPVKDIADANNVGFIVGEVGICNNSIANPIAEEDAKEYGREMVDMFEKYGIAYGHFNYMSDIGFARQFNPDMPGRDGETMTYVEYEFEDYKTSFYVDKELLDIWAGK